MSRRCPIALPTLKVGKYLLQLITSSEYYSNVNYPKIKEKAEVVKITIIEGILVIPLNLQTYAILKAIDFVGRRVSSFISNQNRRREVGLFPPTLTQK